MVLKVRSQEAIAQRVRLSGNFTRVLDRLRAVAANEVENAKEHPSRGRPILINCRSSEYAACWPVASEFVNQVLDFQRSLLGPIGVRRTAFATLSQLVLADHGLRVGIENAKPEAADVNQDYGATVTRRSRIVSTVNLDVAVEVNAALKNSIVFKACRR